MPRTAATVLVALSVLATTLASSHGDGAGDETVMPIADAALALQGASRGTAVRVDFPPGGVSRSHVHPGAVFVVVLRGEIESAVDDRPPQLFKAGQAWYQAPGQVHRLTRNPSGTQPASLVAWILSDGRAPLVSPLPP